jgi:L-iditol 2-dehydrogenase
MARTGGKLALVGMGTPNPTLPLGAAALREVDLIGIFRYANTWPDALRLLASKTMADIDKVMVTQKYSLEETANAFQVIASAKDDSGEMVLKVMVGPGY